MCVVEQTGGDMRMRMGGVMSRRHRRRRRGGGGGGQRRWAWAGPPGDHSPYPLDTIPYPGPGLLYCFIDIMTKYKIMRNTVNLGPSVVTTDVEDYFDELSDCYREGFSLNHFVKIPGVKATTEIQDWGIPHPYQAILSKPSDSVDSKSRWELKMEKRIISTKLLATGYYEEDDLLETIHEYAETGARLACAQVIGYVRSGTSNRQYTVMGVDLFFNLPTQRPVPRYRYHTIKVPVRYVVVPDSTQTVQQIECDADWMGQLKIFLDKGWKLVDICIDTTALAEAFGMKTSSKLIDTIWIFEKRLDQIEDLRPQYEGVILEYYHKTKRLVGEETPCKDWRPVIAGMGVSGWELTTILQTPYLSQSTFTTYTMKLLMIFQRRILPDHQRQIQDAIRKQREEKLEKERKKFGAAPSNANAGDANAARKPRQSQSPRSPRGSRSPRQGAPRRYVYADQALLDGGLIGNGSVRTGVGAAPLAGEPQADGDHPRAGGGWGRFPP